MKLEGFYAHLDGDIKKRFETFNYEVKKPLPTEKKKQKRSGGDLRYTVTSQMTVVLTSKQRAQKICH